MARPLGPREGGAEVPVEFLVEMDELHLGGEHRVGFPQ